MIRLLLLIPILYILWVIVIFGVQRMILFPRLVSNWRYASPPPQVEVWRETRPDGVSSEAWFVRAKGDGPRPAIVLLHGNAMLVQDWLDWADELSMRGWHVLLPEFRGYGVSPGEPSRDAIVGDTIAAINTLRSREDVDTSRVVIYGRSLGANIAAEAAVGLALPPAALILHTPPARIRDFAWGFGVPPIVIRDPFDAMTASAALRGRIPITVIQHRSDEIVPADHVRRVAEQAGVDAIELEGSHNRFADSAAQRRFDEVIREVLDAVERGR